LRLAFRQGGLDLRPAQTQFRAGCRRQQRIRDLIADIQRDPFKGIGKPEPLRHPLGGSWSRRITGEHRLVYRVEGKPPVLTIAQCRYHY